MDGSQHNYNNSIICYSGGNPKKALCDFEKGIWNALQLVSPTTQISGCLFHWIRAIDANIASKDLRSLQKNSPTFAHSIRMLKTLPFFPPAEVYKGYEEFTSYLDEHQEVQYFF